MLLALVPSRKEKIDMHAANIFSVGNLKKTWKTMAFFHCWRKILKQVKSIGAAQFESKAFEQYFSCLAHWVVLVTSQIQWYKNAFSQVQCAVLQSYDNTR